MRRRRRRPIEVEILELIEPTIPDLADAIAERALVDGVLRRLDERGRSIIVLHYFLDLPISEVAACLGIPTGTAKSRLNHALAQLRSGVADVPQVEALASGRTLA
jgi:RNA polymerase sigma-70 factor (ECF subfamily)